MRRFRPRLLLLFAVLGAGLSRPALADLYGFVDENGVPHISRVPLDERYQLFKKEFLPPKPVAEAPPAVSRAVPHPRGRKRYGPLVDRVARQLDVEPALMHAVISVESAYDPGAISPKGAVGLMQVMPDTGRRYGIRDLGEPLQNLRAGAGYLRDLLRLFDNDLMLALSAYNAGEGAVMRHGFAIPPYRETRDYVVRVLDAYRRHKGR